MTCTSTSSARIKAEAERAALIECAAVLKKIKHLIEAQEEQLRMAKERLELETEMAADAKNSVLEAHSSRCGSRVSRVSDGMLSYFEKANAQSISNLNPAAASYIPTKERTDNLPPPLVVRPKERTQDQISKSDFSVKTNVKTQIPNHIKKLV